MSAVDHLSEQVKRYADKIRELQAKNRTLTAENEKLKRIVEVLEKQIDDFKNFGTRHDTNPTGQFRQCGCFDSFKGDHWQGYIRSQDRHVRETARQAKEEVERMRSEGDE